MPSSPRQNTTLRARRDGDHISPNGRNLTALGEAQAESRERQEANRALTAARLAARTAEEATRDEAREFSGSECEARIVRTQQEDNGGDGFVTISLAHRLVGPGAGITRAQVLALCDDLQEIARRMTL